MTTPRITDATITDAEALADIYAYHVLHGTGTFETVPPGAADFAARIARVRDARAPWLVAREPDGTPLGYAYAAQFRDRAAYRFACEDSIYVRQDQRGAGLGSALLTALIAASTTAGFRQMFAVIGGPEPASVRLHERAGFVECGRLRGIGWKHERWLDTLYMRLALGRGDEEPPETKTN